MADVVRVSAPDLTQAAATVAQHMETAAHPPHSAAPSPTPASPVDAAAAGAASAIQAKVSTLSTQLAPRGPAIQQAGAAAASSLQAQDATNAARIPSAPDVPAVGPLSFGSSPATDIASGLIVLCEPGPRGGPWAFDCHVFYPNGMGDMYPSDDDESGGYP